MNRRAFVATLAGAAALKAQRNYDEPIAYPDPDISALDPRFSQYIVFNSPIKRLHLGTLWAEGCAWSGWGKFVVWSDIPNNVQLRWLEEDGHVSAYHRPSNQSNGNTFDFQGRQLSCEHLARRVTRYEPDGTVTVIASTYNGKPLNSPNDVVVHPDGAIYFTDPTYGIAGNYEGLKAQPELKQAVYRVDPQSGQIAMVTDELDQPNGVCFSQDYKKLYVADTGAPGRVKVWDLNSNGTLSNGRDLQPHGPYVTADGLRCDTDGNLWCGDGRGVSVVTSGGDAIGRIKLPETCANVVFGGTRRNRLFMAASQSLYSVYVNTQGAHIT